MAVAKNTFGADVNDWVRETEARMNAVFRGSAQEVVSEMQKPVSEGGHMPIDTGFLRSSMQVAVNSEPVSTSQKNPGAKVNYNPTAAALAIAGASIGDTITASYSANYAPAMEYGTSKTAGRGFVRLAAAQWQVIVQHQTVRAMLTAYSNRRKAA